MPTEGIDEAQALAAAGDLARQYGVDASVIATLRAAEEAARGDGPASDFWMHVSALLDDEASGAMVSKN